MLEVRFARDDEQAQVEQLAQTDPVIKDFVYVWRRWKNWGRSNPAVALVDGKIVGFQAVTFGVRNLYVNTYYITVHPDFRGQRIASALMQFILQEARKRGCKRLKLKTKPEGSDGHLFWTKIGAQIVEYVYDVSLDDLKLKS